MSTPPDRTGARAVLIRRATSPATTSQCRVDDGWVRCARCGVGLFRMHAAGLFKTDCCGW